jgi:predicted ATP-dependent serine protease
MDDLERKQQLTALSEYAAEALAGSPGPAQGRLVLVAGEAGVGKSSLLEASEAFEESLPGHHPLLG